MQNRSEMEFAMIRNALEFGSAVRQARKLAGLNQSELAARAGVNVMFISDLESGKGTCQLDKALTVACELGFQFSSQPGPAPVQPDGDEEAEDHEDPLGHLPSF